jgi:hypothetical protein
MKVPKPGESQFSIHPLMGPSGKGVKPFTLDPPDIEQAGPIAAPSEAEGPPGEGSVAERTRSGRGKPDVK